MAIVTISMTRDEALVFSNSLDESQKSCVSAIEKIGRMRMRDSEKAMAQASFSRRLDDLRELNDRIMRAANIKGY